MRGRNEGNLFSCDLLPGPVMWRKCWNKQAELSCGHLIYLTLFASSPFQICFSSDLWCINGSINGSICLSLLRQLD